MVGSQCMKRSNKIVSCTYATARCDNRERARLLQESRLMAQVSKQQVRSRQPAQRAQGLDPEITAQPRSLPDELALEASAEPELSVDADELGSRFLRDAIEQGDFDPERAWPEESSLIDAPARDQPLSGSHFVAGNSVWEQTVDLETRTQGAADMLREPAPPTAADFDAALRETAPDPIDVGDNSAHSLDNNVREFSLFDASEDTEETRVPRTSERVRIDREPEQESHERRTSGAAPRSGSVPARALRAVLSSSADVLRNLASRLRHRGS